MMNNSKNGEKIHAAKQILNYNITSPAKKEKSPTRILKGFYLDQAHIDALDLYNFQHKDTNLSEIVRNAIEQYVGDEIMNQYRGKNEEYL